MGAQKIYRACGSTGVSICRGDFFNYYFEVFVAFNKYKTLPELGPIEKNNGGILRFEFFTAYAEEH